MDGNDGKIVIAQSVVDAERIAKGDKFQQAERRRNCQHHWGKLCDPATGRVVGTGCRLCGKVRRNI